VTAGRADEAAGLGLQRARARYAAARKRACKAYDEIMGDAPAELDLAAAAARLVKGGRVSADVLDDYLDRTIRAGQAYRAITEGPTRDLDQELRRAGIISADDDG
jgi:hypothetical protein